MIHLAIAFVAGLALGATVLYAWTKKQLASVEKAASAAVSAVTSAVTSAASKL